jgi:signal transduction histidine kinase
LEGSIRGAGDAARASTASNLERPGVSSPFEAAAEAIETVVSHGGLSANDVHLVLLDRDGRIGSNPEDVDAAAMIRGSSLEEALRDGEYWHTAEVSGAKLRVKTFPLMTDAGELIGFVQAAKSVEDNEAALRTLLLVMMGAGGFSLVLFAVGGYIVAGKAIEPVQKGYERQRQFVADASHELRTPLTVIRTNTELLLHRGRQDPAIDDVDAEVRYMTQLIDNLLSLANGDGGLLRAEMQPVVLSEVARSAARPARSLAEANGLTFREELDDQVLVSADPDLCRQAIFILLDNAIKYTPTGGSIVLATRRDEANGAVEVSDSGIGMTEDELAHATDRFFSGDKARSRLRGGAGLGLSIAKELMLALNGRLELKSEHGKGTSARLVFSLALQSEALRLRPSLTTGKR